MKGNKLEFYCVKVLNVIKNMSVVDALAVLKTVELSIIKSLKKDGDKK